MAQQLTKAEQLEADLKFVRDMLPDHYTVTESKVSGSIHCVSTIGIPDQLPPIGVEVQPWEPIFDGFKSYFGERFSEVFHNVCHNHTDFTIYVKTKEDRSVCTKERPYTKGAPGRWEHPDAVEEGEDYGRGGGVADGDYIDYKCPNCGLKFKVELPN